MSVPSSGSDVQQTVTELNAGWYNVVTAALKIQDPTFLLAQGTLGLQTSDSSGVFMMSDAVPPSAAVAYFDAGGMQMRSNAYTMLLAALLPETGTSLQQVLADQYANWVAYRNGYTWPTGSGQPTTQQQLFEQWANQRLDPRLASAAVTAYKQAATCPLNTAIDALHAKDSQQSFANTSGQPYRLYPYTATVSGAQQAIATGGSATISFDSKTMNTKLNQTTVQGSASGFYDIFSGGASGGFDQLNQTAAGSEWSISGTINKFATLATQPAGAWFNSAELTRAFNARNDNTVWDPMANAGTWDSYFGQPDGSLARHVSQLVLVSDYTITVTSHANYSSEDATTINAEASFGVWPFFSAEASTTHKQVATVNTEGELVVTHTLNKGLIEIWGVTTQNVPK